jgi:hypothetical protein
MQKPAGLRIAFDRDDPWVAIAMTPAGVEPAISIAAKHSHG